MRQRSFFLPNFCEVGNVFAVVLTAELFAFLLTLANPIGEQFWSRLSLISLVVQWVALGNAALLCLLRPALARLGNRNGALAAYGVVLSLTLLVVLVAAWLLPRDAGQESGLLYVLRAMALTAIVAAVVLRYLYIGHQGRMRVENTASARIEALQSRIRPHFLFNALNTIASLIPVEPAKAEAFVEDMADLFRASLSKGDRMVSVAEEIELSRQYLTMEGIRLGERLRVVWHVDPAAGEALLPPMTVQPLLENAVYYGVEPRLEGGTVTISVVRAGQLVRLQIRNPKPAAGRARSRGIGMAQDNIKERLRLAFDGESRFGVEETANHDYVVSVEFPMRTP